MSPERKNDQSDKVDTLLRGLGSPTRDDAAWDANKDAIVKAAQSAASAADDTLAALFSTPALSPEPGEPSQPHEARPRLVASSGEKSMSQDSNPGSSAKPESAPMSGATSAAAATSKRPSLKELAARASQAGATTKPSVPPGALSAPVVSKPLSEAPPPPADKPARATTPSVAPIASKKSDDDSGIVNLNAINEAATAKQIADAEKAKPATHDLLDEGDGEKKAVAASDAKVKSLADARQKKEEKKGGGAVWGIVVAVVGVAAAAAIMLKGKPPAPAPTATVGQEKPAVEAQAQQPEAKPVAEAPKPASTGLSIDSLPSEPSPSDAPKAGGAGPQGAGTDAAKVAAAPTATSTEAAPAAPTNAAPTPTPGKPDDLSSAMAHAVGGSAEKGTDSTEAAVPAAGKNGNQNIPEQPSQGSVASAIGAVMSGAKACVAGADDVSRAQVTFSSNGTVSNVSVSGWAAAHGKSGCVQAALKGAKTGPFSKPSFTVGTTIRP